MLNELSVHVAPELPGWIVGHIEQLHAGTEPGAASPQPRPHSNPADEHTKDGNLVLSFQIPSPPTNSFANTSSRVDNRSRKDGR